MDYIYFKNHRYIINGVSDIYTFLDVLKENMDVLIYYNLIHAIDIYLLKSIWNSILNEWNKSKKFMEKSIKDSKSKNKAVTALIKNDYIIKSYKIIHNIIYPEDFNKVLIEFINEDKFKAIFVINCILKYT